MSRFLFLDSRSGFGIAIWSGRTQLSIVIGFAAAPMRGNRILRSAVPVGRRVPYSVAAPVGAAVPPQTKKRHPNWVPLC